MSAVPNDRIRALNDAAFAADRDYVVYWMVAARRTRWNFALDRAIELAHEHGKPLIVLEALRCGYRWASDRFHAFVLEGMADNERALAGTNAIYYPYVESSHGAGKGLLAALAARACAVVTDDYPCFMIPAMQAAAAGQVDCRLEAVDGNGLVPVRATSREFTRAYSFRRYLQGALPSNIAVRPRANPFAVELASGELPAEVLRRWPRASAALLRVERDALAELPIDHSVERVRERGGADRAQRVLEEFVGVRLRRYDEDRNHPARDGTSGLSPYLHFGHLSVHEIFSAIADAEEWDPSRLGERPTGKREGFWGMSGPAESFLDELVTWRELGFNMCVTRADYDRYESLPEWARTTLEEHEGDPREHLYSLAELERAETHDELWNAAQRQLVREGRIHNYLRMLWGKKVLEWTVSPRQALAILIELNNKYALDGRDPNSYSGIFWVLGRYDRAWGPERPIFGKIRYMSSPSTRRKTKVDEYISRFAGAAQQPMLPL